MTRLQEYFMDFKLVHTIKGHGLCKLLKQEMLLKKYLSGWEKEIEMYNIEHVPQSMSTMPWYEYLRKFLEHGTLPSYLSNKQKREISLKSLSYQLFHGVIFLKHHNGSY